MLMNTLSAPSEFAKRKTFGSVCIEDLYTLNAIGLKKVEIHASDTS